MDHDQGGPRDLLARRRALDRAWRSFVDGGGDTAGVSDAILRSWRRSRDTYRVDPGQRRCARLLPPDGLAARREGDELFPLARPVLEEFGARLASSSAQVLALFDAPGWMLWLGGDPATAERLGEINFSPGSNWLEESTGTNGPGTALAEGRPLEVFASEHFVQACQAWSCAASPVRAPGSGELLGVVDLTGPWDDGEANAIVAARAIAQALEERVRSRQAVRDQVVEHAFRLAAAAGDGLLAVDGRGRLLAVNDDARRRLTFYGTELPAAARAALCAALARGAADREEFPVDWPDGAAQVRLLASPVRYDRQAIGAVVRVVGPPRPRPAARRPGGPHPAAARYSFDHILGESEAVRRALAAARAAARTDLPVVIVGESGTGKELFAQAIHAAGARALGPFNAVNCGSIPPSLLEAELFGYEAGTFTGGRREGNAGKFEEAAGGTLFLDEVSELSPGAQTALLRVLQEREVVRLGGSTPRPVDLRVMAASNRSLAEEVRARRFRQDLYFRLNVLVIDVPPLRERRADVRLLAESFLREPEVEALRPGLAFAEEALRALERHAWPGNVRELRNVVQRAAATAAGAVIALAELPEELRAPPPASEAARAPAAPAPAMADLGRDELLRALEASSWNVARTAKALGVSRMTLYRWLHKHGIER